MRTQKGRQQQVLQERGGVPKLQVEAKGLGDMKNLSILEPE